MREGDARQVKRAQKTPLDSANKLHAYDYASTQDGVKRESIHYTYSDGKIQYVKPY